MADGRNVVRAPCNEWPEKIIGTRLRTVRYRTLPNLAEQRYVRFLGLHDVPMGIELETCDGEIFRITWIRDAAMSWMDFTRGSMQERFPGSTLPAVEVAEWTEWRKLLTRVLTQILTLQGQDGARIGLRLGFDDGSVVTVVLGEVDATGQPVWSPDNIVVLFDRHAADSYVRSLGHLDGRLTVVS